MLAISYDGNEKVLFELIQLYACERPLVFVYDTAMSVNGVGVVLVTSIEY